MKKDKKQNESKTCFGTDLNRNWNAKWTENDDTTKSVCSDFYGGPNSFSEPETYALSKFLLDKRKHLKLFISLHGYGQIITYPLPKNSTASSYNELNKTDLSDMAQIAIQSLRSIGSSTHYFIDTTNELLYKRYGSSDLFAMYNCGIKYSYTIELRDTGTHGFLLPSAYIESTGKETFEMIKGMVNYL